MSYPDSISTAQGVNHGFIITTKEFITLDFPNSTFTQALGLNNKGIVVGSYMDSSGGTHGFLFKDGHFQSIDDPNGVGTTIVTVLRFLPISLASMSIQLGIPYCFVAKTLKGL